HPTSPHSFPTRRSSDLAVGLAAVATTAYRWAQPRYATHTAPGHASPGVLHVAFERSLPIGEMEQMLRSAGARVVEGPDATGIFEIGRASWRERVEEWEA